MDRFGLGGASRGAIRVPIRHPSCDSEPSISTVSNGLPNVTSVKLDTLQTLFERRFGAPPASVLRIQADGSNRVMYRLVGEGYDTAIGVVGPDPDENRAFLSFTENFRSIHLPVPEVYAAAEEAGVYLEEDLGDTTLFGYLTRERENTGEEFPESVRRMYERVLETLPRFQIEGGRVIDYSVAYPRAAFDRQSILWDLNYFKYHFLKLAHVPFHESELERDFRTLTRFLLRADLRHFLYRDFQSKNVMVREGEPIFIDYQGGRRGALQYDVASMLYDAKAAVPQEERNRLLEHYMDALEEHQPVDRDSFRLLFRGYVLVRIMQAMGAYGYRGFFERKPRFLQSVPLAIDNIEQILESDGLPVEMPALRKVFEHLTRSKSLRKRTPPVPPGLVVRVGSFSYKRGYPDDPGGHGGGFVFDCRALHNPGRYAEFADLCGTDDAVSDFLGARGEVDAFWDRVRSLVDHQIETYLARGFNSLNVQFGCTGGQHRSVFFAERLRRHIEATFRGVHVEVTHREEGAWSERRAESLASA